MNILCWVLPVLSLLGAVSCGVWGGSITPEEQAVIATKVKTDLAEIAANPGWQTYVAKGLEWLLLIGASVGADRAIRGPTASAREKRARALAKATEEAAKP